MYFVCPIQTCSLSFSLTASLFLSLSAKGCVVYKCSGGIKQAGGARAQRNSSGTGAITAHTFSNVPPYFYNSLSVYHTNLIWSLLCHSVLPSDIRNVSCLSDLELLKEQEKENCSFSPKSFVQ